MTLPQILQHHKASLLTCKGTSAISAFLFINCYASAGFANDPSSSTEASPGLLPFTLVTSPTLSLFPFATCNLCLVCQIIRHLPILLEDSQRLEEM